MNPPQLPPFAGRGNPSFNTPEGESTEVIFFIFENKICVLFFLAIFRCELSLKCRWSSSCCFNEGLCLCLAVSCLPSLHTHWRKRNAKFGNSHPTALIPRTVGPMSILGCWWHTSFQSPACDLLMLWFLDARSEEQYMLCGAACTWAAPRIGLNTG